MRIALLQINPTAGDIGGNSALIVDGAQRARRAGRGSGGHARAGADGLSAARSADEPRLRAAELRGAGPHRRGTEGRARRCWWASRRRIPPKWAGRCSTAPCCCRTAPSGRPSTKPCCPPTTFSTRTATSSRPPSPEILELDGCRLGISICEDVWNDRDFWQRRRYHHDPIEVLAQAGAQAIVNLSASPFTVGKQRCASRCSARWRESTGCRCMIVNQVGGNDDLIFDGRSAAFDAQRPAVRPRQGLRRRRADGRPRGRRPGTIARGRLHARGRNLERARAGRPRLRAQDALPQGAARAFPAASIRRSPRRSRPMPWVRKTCSA